MAHARPGRSHQRSLRPTLSYAGVPPPLGTTTLLRRTAGGSRHDIEREIEKAFDSPHRAVNPQDMGPDRDAIRSCRPRSARTPLRFFVRMLSANVRAEHTATPLSLPLMLPCRGETPGLDRCRRCRRCRRLLTPAEMFRSERVRKHRRRRQSRAAPGAKLISPTRNARGRANADFVKGYRLEIKRVASPATQRTTKTQCLRKRLPRG